MLDIAMKSIVQIITLILIIASSAKSYSQIAGIYSTIPDNEQDSLTYIEIRPDSSILFQELPFSYGIVATPATYKSWTTVLDTIIFWTQYIPYYYYDWGDHSKQPKKKPVQPDRIPTKVLISNDTLCFLEGEHKGLQLLRIMTLQNPVAKHLIGKWKLCSVDSDISFTFELNADGTYRHLLCKRCDFPPVYQDGNYIRYSNVPLDDFSRGNWTLESEVLTLYGKLGMLKNTELYRFRLDKELNLYVLDETFGWNWNESFNIEGDKALIKVW